MAMESKDKVKMPTLKEEFERRKMLDSTKSEKCMKNGIEIIYYADYDYDFPYEVIKDKDKLLSIILEKK